MKAMVPGIHSVPPGESAREPAGEVPAGISTVASLNEATRLRIYDHVCVRAEPVSRDDVAEALGIPLRTAAFHLDRLAQEGLVVVSFGRRTGRSGPGAGRPSKLYLRSAREVSVTLPPRRYDLAGSLLAGALVEAERSGQAPCGVLRRRARALGQALVGEQPDEGSTSALMSLLESHGYEPRVESPDILLNNCPFHALAQEHTDLICGMNLHLLEGVLDGFGIPGLRACLDPKPSRCCVRLPLG